MLKRKLFAYLGTNGTLLTPIKVVGAQGVVKYELIAEEGKVLTKDKVHFYQSITVPEDELEGWIEVKDEGQGQENTKSIAHNVK